MSCQTGCRLGRCEDAVAEYEQAAALSGNAAERAFLLGRADSLRDYK